MPVSVILDNLRSAFNVGSIVRTADCSLIKEVITCGITAHPPHRKLEKTSMGALEYVDVRYNASVLDAVKAMKKEGVPVLAFELTEKSTCLWNIDFPLPSALVFGNEALGISQEILQAADTIIEIPTLGFKNSLNVATAFGIVVYEIQRQHWNSITNGHDSRPKVSSYHKREEA